MNDDMYPNDGAYFMPREPEDQVIARKKEKAKTLEAVKVIDMVIQHFDERIAFRDTLGSIKVDLTKDPELHLRACGVNDLLKQALMEEKQLLEELLEIHTNR